MFYYVYCIVEKLAEQNIGKFNINLSKFHPLNFIKEIFYSRAIASIHAHDQCRRNKMCYVFRKLAKAKLAYLIKQCCSMQTNSEATELIENRPFVRGSI